MAPIYLRAVAAALACAIAGPACAHAMLVTPAAEAGSFYKAAIAITHGCAGSATREVIVEIPAGVQNAKPMPKPGWRIELTSAPLAQPRESHGRKISEAVTRIRFYGGKLPNAYYDEFSIAVTLPDQAEPVYWPVTQICERGRNEWREVPAPGQSAADLKSPAPRLDLTPPGPMAHHRH